MQTSCFCNSPVFSFPPSLLYFLEFPEDELEEADDCRLLPEPAPPPPAAAAETPLAAAAALGGPSPPAAAATDGGGEEAAAAAEAATAAAARTPRGTCCCCCWRRLSWLVRDTGAEGKENKKMMFVFALYWVEKTWFVPQSLPPSPFFRLSPPTPHGSS